MISFDKFHQFLTEYKYSIQRVYMQAVPMKHSKESKEKIEQVCRLIEVVHCENGQTIFIYIPKKYKFHSIHNVDKCYLEYVPRPTENNMEIIKQTYTNDYKMSNIEDVEDMYKQEIINSDKKESIVCFLYEQLSKLKYSIYNVKYKLVMVHSNYIAILSDGANDNINVYSIANYISTPHYNIHALIDIGYFYEKINFIYTDVNSIFSGLYNVLEKNISCYNHKCQDIIQAVSDSMSMSIVKNISNAQEEYYTLKKEYEHVLEQIKQEEDAKILQLDKLKQISGREIKETMKVDFSISKLMKEIDKLARCRNDVITNITNMNKEYSHMILLTDIILFDNISMMNKITKNIQILRSA